VYGVPMGQHYDSPVPAKEDNVTAIIVGFFATVGVAALAFASYLFYLTPGPRDSLE
jgi:hypothetical protein